MNKFIINDKIATIEKVFHRTKGSNGQKLFENSPEDLVLLAEHLEDRRSFYLVDIEGETFWVKEYVDKEYGGTLGWNMNIAYEYYYTKFMSEFSGAIQIDWIKHIIVGVTPPVMMNEEKTMIVFPYIEGKSLKYYRDEKWYGRAHEALRVWTKKVPVSNYDMCENNVLVEIKDNILLHLIDFEYSEDRDPKNEDDPVRRNS